MHFLSRRFGDSTWKFKIDYIGNGVNTLPKKRKMTKKQICIKMFKKKFKDENYI